ncbi:four-carbon acid sugar kinase family protein [Devosia sp. A449]
MELTVRVAIVADDLTGALDASAPFAARGLRCNVATNPRGIAAALAQGGDVVCVNTASREKSASEAQAIVRHAASILAASGPLIALKKVDSRLKGHVAEESAACLEAFGRQQIIVAPAIPSQGRLVKNGQVIGKGLDASLDIATRFGGLELTAPDIETIEDLQAVAGHDWREVLFVGASGLGESLARALGTPDRHPFVSIHGPLLLAIGSHDPITLAQVARASALPEVRYQITTDGSVEPNLTAPTTLYRAESTPASPSHASVLKRFGVSIAARLRQGDVATVLLCGGETAQTVLGELGIDCVELVGEALPGIAVSRARLDGRDLTILTKSGGFGTPDDLLVLARAANKTIRSTDINKAGTKA